MHFTYFPLLQNRQSESYPGSACIAEVARVLRPRYHFAGLEGVFYERQPYRWYLMMCFLTIIFFSTVFYTYIPVSFWPSLGSLSHFRMCVEENAVAVVSEIHALVSENSTLLSSQMGLSSIISNIYGLWWLSAYREL